MSEPSGTGADIAGAGIGADHIRLGRDADLEAAGLDRCEAQMAVGAYDAQRPVGGALMLNRDRHVMCFQE